MSGVHKSAETAPKLNPVPAKVVVNRSMECTGTQNVVPAPAGKSSEAKTGLESQKRPS
jgi:hypothetical protein